MKSWTTFSALTVGLVVASQPVVAQVLLNFDSLPSAQGWTYTTSNEPEEAIYSVDGTALHQDTMGTGLGQGGSAYQYYILNGAVDPVQTSVITVQANILDSERSDSGGFSFGAFTGTEGFAIFIDLNTIQDSFQTTIGSTAPGFHTYRLEGTPGVGYKFFVDGTQIAAGIPNTAVAGVPNQLFFGDATSGGNARVDITAFSVTTVPEPSTWFMIAVGLAAITSCRRFAGRDA